jgi:hypothetical protein
MKEYLEAFKKAQDMAIKQNRENTKNNPLRSLWEDQHNNTYTRTLEQLKQYINDDSQKELDALKNSITKMAGSDVELAPYGELMISAAEEYAIRTNHGINNNFIKMSSVFNLENQKKLIELIVATQKENEEEIKRKLKNKERRDLEKKMKKEVEKGKKIYEEKLKDFEKTYTFDKFENEFSNDDIKSLSAYLASEDGQEEYKDLIKKNPLYKYLLDVDISELNTLLRSINDLTIIKISDIDNFYSSIVNKEQALYYIMANKSIKDAVKSIKSEKYFGIENIEDVDKSDNTLISNREGALSSAINVGKRGKKKYFLMFNGNGNSIFDILHKDFKTKIFKGDKYVDNISLENKEDLMKIIYKKLKIGNSVSSLFAEYLVRLEAHMLLEKQDKPWFVVENNDKLLQYFKPKSKKILNKNAFVEMSQDDYEKIEPFLTKYHIFSDSDFDIETETKKEEK